MSNSLRLTTGRALVCALALTLVACPKKGPGGGPQPFNSQHGVPADVLAVARIDAPTLLSRAGLKDASALVEKLTEKLRKEIGVDLALLRDATLFYAPGTGESLPRRGAAIIPQVLKDSPGLGKLGAAQEVEGRPAYKLGATATVSFVEGGTVVGDVLSVQQSLQSFAGKRPALAKDDALWRALDAVGNQPFRLSLKLAGLGKFLSRLPVPGLDKVQYAGIGGDVTATDLVLDIVLMTQDAPNLAATLKKAVSELAAQLSSSMIFKIFADLLSGIQITAGVDRVSVNAKLPIGLMETLLPIVMGTMDM